MVVGLLLAGALLIGRLFSLQILDDKYKESAWNNSLYYDVIYPTRGVIYDRNGNIIVGNKVAYDIMVTPKDVPPFDTVKLASVLGVEESFLKERFAEFSRRKDLSHQNRPLLRSLTPEDYMKFSEVQYLFPGFKGQVRSIRDYPVNAGGNLLGYVAEVDQNFLRKHQGEYRSGDYAGRTGIEAAREKDLRGEKGYHIYLRNSHNQIEAPYKNGEMDKEAVPGHDIYTTIDADLQQYGQQLMQNKVGSVVAIEPSTGEILSLISSPGINVDQLANFGKHYSEIMNDPHRPMYNRAVQASYPPGSVFKLVNGLIGLQEGVLKPEYTYPCNYGYYYGSHNKLGCHGHPSPLDLEHAVMMSCNGYFCYVLKNVLENKKYPVIDDAIDNWREYVMSFGLGRKLGSDFPSELGGTIPSSATYNKRYGQGGWKFTTIVSLSIGQGEIGVTPMQIANLCAIVANRGYYYIPHIVKASEGVEIDPKYRERQYTMVDTTYFMDVIPGMWLAVNGGPGSGGTATSVAVPGLDMCGKTGTAQNPRGADNSVFICFAPKDNPKIAIAAYIENGGFGVTWAAPIASLMVEKYLNGEISSDPYRQALQERILQGDLMSRVKGD